MNVIFDTIGCECLEVCTAKLISRFKFDELFAVFASEEAAKASPFKCTESYGYRECMRADYKDKICNEDKTPIDGALLKQFEPYMTILLKMVERLLDGDLDFESRVANVFRSIEYWNTIIERYDIKLFVAYDVPHEIFDYIIYALCKIKSIPCIYSDSCFVLGYSYIASDIENCCPSVIETYKELLLEYQSSEIESIPLEGAYLKYFQEHTTKDADITPYYMKRNQEVSPVKLKGFKRIKNIFRLLSEDFSHNMKMWVEHICYKIKTFFKPIENTHETYMKRWSLVCEDIDITKKYIYFPLHCQPKATTSPRGGYYVWQLLAIKMISKCLPENVYIYVKENPIQTTRGRSESFEKQLKKIPRVKLVSVTYDTYDLMENCIAVASITGTALIEGVFKGKRGIMFGNLITQYVPGIFKVNSNAECKNAIDFILTNEATHTVKELKIFLLAMSKICFAGAGYCPPLRKVMTEGEIGESMYEGFSSTIVKIN